MTNTPDCLPAELYEARRFPRHEKKIHKEEERSGSRFHTSNKNIRHVDQASTRTTVVATIVTRARPCMRQVLTGRYEKRRQLRSRETVSVSMCTTKSGRCHEKLKLLCRAADALARSPTRSQRQRFLLGRACQVQYADRPDLSVWAAGALSDPSLFRSRRGKGPEQKPALPSARRVSKAAAREASQESVTSIDDWSALGSGHRERP